MACRGKGYQAIADSLLAVIRAHGGRVHTSFQVEDLDRLPPSDAIILNLTPRQVLRLKGLSVSRAVSNSLAKWKYGAAVYKVDFSLREPVPWSDPLVGISETVHLGGSLGEISWAEQEVAAGRLPQNPFVMACQQYIADPSRGLSLWTYAHVPHGYSERFPGEIREKITCQIERFAPGFRDVVQDVYEVIPTGLEQWNPNLVGGDIAGGSMGSMQILLRPQLAFSPHRLDPQLFMASSSTSPGAGVHGVPGWWAAEEAFATVE